MGVNRDITTHMQIESNQRTLETKLSTILQMLPVGVAILDADHNISYVNQALTRILDLSEEQLRAGNHRGRSYITAAGAPMPPSAFASNRALAEQREIDNIETGIITESGKQIWTSVSAVPVQIPGWSVITVTSDITAHKRTEQALHANEERFRAIIENGTEGIILVNADRQTIYVSPTVTSLLGYPPETFAKLRARGLSHPDDLPKLEQFIAALRAQPGATAQTITRLRHQDGSWHWMDQRGVNQCHNPAIQAIIVSFHDVTEHTLAEIALHQAEQRFVDAFHASPAAVAISEAATGRYLEVNPSLLELTGYTRAELAETTSLTLGLCVDSHEHTSLHEQLSVHGHVRNHAIQLRAKSGDLRHVLVSLTPITWNQTACCFTVINDITERVQAEQALHQSNARFATAFHSSPAGIVISRIADRYVLDANESYLRLVGYARAEVVGNTWANLNILSDRMLHIELQPDLQAHGRIANREVAITTKSGEQRTVLFSTELLMLDGEQSVITTCIDITDRVRAEQALAAEHERVMRLKNEFMAMMSHELRTPLSAVLGRSEMLSDGFYGTLNERQANALETITQSGHHLLALITNILDYTKFESGSVELRYEPIIVEELCRTALQSVAAVAQRKRIVPVLMIDRAVQVIDADPRRLHQILIYLLSNAIKFTPPGGEVGLDVRGDPQRKQASFTIWDTGIGIAPADQARIFEPFTQLDSRLSRQYEGTGLGLALVQRLVTAHGGTISLVSTHGHGSRFSVTLRWDPDAAKHEEHAEEESHINPTQHTLAQPLPAATLQRILLVEDRESNLSMLEDMLAIPGYQTVAAHDGLEGLALTHAHHPDLIILDIQLPKMNGIEVIQHIRADPQLRSIPIIALTALVMPGDRERCLEAGANAYLAKPVGAHQLLATVAELLEL